MEEFGTFRRPGQDIALLELEDEARLDVEYQLLPGTRGKDRRRHFEKLGLVRIHAHRIADRDRILGQSLDADIGIPYPVVLEVGEDRSEEHTSELQSLMRISYAVFCLKKKNKNEIYKTV